MYLECRMQYGAILVITLKASKKSDNEMLWKFGAEGPPGSSAVGRRHRVPPQEHQIRREGDQGVVQGLQGKDHHFLIGLLSLSCLKSKPPAPQRNSESKPMPYHITTYLSPKTGCRILWAMPTLPTTHSCRSYVPMGPRKRGRLASHVELVKMHIIRKIGRPFTYPLQEMDVYLLNSNNKTYAY